jgi:hypothetical protein
LASAVAAAMGRATPLQATGAANASVASNPIKAIGAM